jgi:beta-N-acetylhexosaminidase
VWIILRRRAVVVVLAAALLSVVVVGLHRGAAFHSAVPVASRHAASEAIGLTRRASQQRLLTKPARASRRSAPSLPGVGGLSIDQLAGQRIVYAYSGLRPPASLLLAIRRGEAAGVIFFASNVSSLSQVRSVIAELQKANTSSPVRAPLLMLTDQEGGEVRRLPGAPLLSEKQIGENARAVAVARDAGAGAGQNLAGVGMNVNLAPVLDVFRQSGDFIDEFHRSYSSSPALVARLAEAFISSQQARGVAATAKHFPGLGAASQDQDTDVAPVRLNVPLGQLRGIDEAPYRAAIAAGVKLVMLSWAVYPALDPRTPAGLSPTVIGGELRGRLGFRGVTITDALGAGALDGFGTIERRGVLAARAGEDLLLCAATNADENTPADGVAVLHGIASALAHSHLSRTSADEAVRTIIQLRWHP